MTGGWLALDTATDVLSVAARRAEGPVSVVVQHGARRQAAEIVASIDRVLGQAGLAVSGLAGIVVTDGPGSFTGLRISWGAAKGIAHERGIPLYTVPSLLGAAFSAWAADGAERDASMAACYDALRGQVFAAVYRFSPPAVTTVVAPAVTTVSHLAGAAPERPRAAVGDGARRYAADVSAWTGRPPLDAPGGPPLQPVAAALLELTGWPGVVEQVADPATREPAYGRPAEAQVTWEARHGRPLPDPTRRSR